MHRFPDFQRSLKIAEKFLGMEGSWKLRSPHIAHMDRQDSVVRSLYNEDHRAEFDSSALRAGSKLSSSNLVVAADWLCAMVAAGPRNRIIKCASSIEDGTKVVEYIVDGSCSYGSVVSNHQHVLYPHSAPKSFILFKIQPWTVEPGHLGPLFPRAKLDNRDCSIVFANCITNLTAFLWPAISSDVMQGFTHNIISIQ